MQFWRSRRVLVTGHTGFKGSWLCLWLQSLGAEVIGYSLPAPTKPSMFETANIGSTMTSIVGDVRDLQHLKKVVSEHKPEVVFHLAAQPIVRTSYAEPLQTFETNVMGTANVLEVMRTTDSLRVGVCITSDKCYRNQEWHWGYREDEVLGGYDPYSGSKACAELVAATYRHAFLDGRDERAVATARAGNVIGGGDWAADRLVPDAVRSFSAGKPVRIRYPNSIRPWQHVLVPLSGYLRLGERLWTDGQAVAEAWNFGPEDGDAEPVSVVIAKLAKLWGGQATWELESAPQLHEDCYLKLDCSKARARLKWAPKLRLDETLSWVVDWYKVALSGGPVAAVTLEQIRQYEALIASGQTSTDSSTPAPPMASLTA